MDKRGNQTQNSESPLGALPKSDMEPEVSSLFDLCHHVIAGYFLCLGHRMPARYLSTHSSSKLPGREGTGEPMSKLWLARAEDANLRKGRDGISLVGDTEDQRFAGGMNRKVGAGTTHA